MNKLKIFNKIVLAVLFIALVFSLKAEKVQAAPTTVSTLALTSNDLNSYYATLKGSANPNNVLTTGHFRVFPTNPSGGCNTDSGGTLYPPVGSIAVGSDSTVHSFSYPIPFNGTFLTPNTTYWYCAYAVGGGTTGATLGGTSGVVTFFTPFGQANPCDAPITGSMSFPVGASCSFTGTTADGVDAGSGTTNTANITLNSGVSLTLNPGQTIARGGIGMSGGTLTLAAGGGLLRAGIFLHDADGDGALDDSLKYVGTAPSAGYIRRTAFQSTATNSAALVYSSNINSIATFDCNANNAYVYSNIPNLVTDADNDGYKTATGAGPQCVGTASTINARTYYKNTSNASTFMDSASALSSGATDCDDTSGRPCPPVLSSVGSATQTSLTVTWSAGTGPTQTSYNLLWCDRTANGACSPSTQISTVTSPYLHNATITCGRTYAYLIRAINASGTSADSNVVATATSTCATAPSITAQSATSPAITSATLNSTVNPNNATTSITYRYSTSNVVCSSLASTLAGPTGLTGSGAISPNATSLTGLTGNTTYYYCSTANNSQGTTNAVSNGNANSSFLSAPGAPTGVSAVAASQTQINVSWTAPTGGATSYNLSYSGGATGIIPGVTSTYAHTGLTCGTSYSYIVRSVNATGTTDSTTAIVSTSSCATAPSITAQGTTSVTTTTAYLTSSGNSNGALTTLTYRYGTSNVACSSLPSTVAGNATYNSGAFSSTSLQIAGLTGNTTYYYCSTANNSQGTTNAVSNGNANSSFLSAPGAPTSVTLSGVTSSNINVSWTAPTGGAASYNLLWCSGASCTPGNGGTYTGVTSLWALSGLTCGTSYSYIVRSVNATGTTDSTTAIVSTSACAAPSVTTSAASSITATSAILNSTINPNGASTSITYRYQTTSTATCNASTPTSTIVGPSGLTGSSPLSGGSTQQSLTGLALYTTYYFCATSTNATGTTYASVLSFRTLRLANGSTCTLGSQCISGNCYADADNDGYAPASGTMTCKASPTAGTDCYDGNANAHPNQTSFFSVDPGNGSFDYDCDGVGNSVSTAFGSQIFGYNTSCTHAATKSTSFPTYLLVSGSCPSPFTQKFSNQTSGNCTYNSTCTNATGTSFSPSQTCDYQPIGSSVFWCQNMTGTILYN